MKEIMSHHYFPLSLFDMYCKGELICIVLDRFRYIKKKKKLLFFNIKQSTVLKVALLNTKHEPAKTTGCERVALSSSQGRKHFADVDKNLI